jgi:hypothetical protein
MYDDIVERELGRARSKSRRFQVNKPRVAADVAVANEISLTIAQSMRAACSLSSSQGVCAVKVDEPAMRAASHGCSGVVGLSGNKPVLGLIRCCLSKCEVI